MQQFQEKQEVARADDIVGTDQPHTALVGMHQGNARIEVMLEIFQMMHRGGYQTFQVGYINKNLTC